MQLQVTNNNEAVRIYAGKEVFTNLRWRAGFIQNPKAENQINYHIIFNPKEIWFVLTSKKDVDRGFKLTKMSMSLCAFVNPINQQLFNMQPCELKYKEMKELRGDKIFIFEKI